MRKDSAVTEANPHGREAFDDIFLDFSQKPGKCRIAESGLGWKPQGGETFTLDKADIEGAQFSRASRGHELKVYARKVGIVQLDGFKPDVSIWTLSECDTKLMPRRTLRRSRNASKSGMARSAYRKSTR